MSEDPQFKVTASMEDPNQLNEIERIRINMAWQMFYRLKKRNVVDSVAAEEAVWAANALLVELGYEEEDDDENDSPAPDSTRSDADSVIDRLVREGK